MAIVVEDATGLDNSETYISVDDFKAYHKDRGNPISLGGSEIEQKLRLAAEYIDIRWGSRAFGDPISEDQALVYPTSYWITDPVGLPRNLVRACAEYAYFAIDNELFIDNNASDGPGVTRIIEKVGPIETQTDWSGSGRGATGRKYPIVTKADRLMAKISSGQSGGVFR